MTTGSPRSSLGRFGDFLSARNCLVKSGRRGCSPGATKVSWSTARCGPRPEDLLRDNFLVIDIDPRLDLSFFRDGRCRCQAQRDMIRDNMEKEITITIRKAILPSSFFPDSFLHLFWLKFGFFGILKLWDY